MVSSRVATALFLALAFSGCGSEAARPSIPVEEANKSSGREDLKKRLLEIAKTGTAGSATAGMGAGIESIRAQDAKLADTLAADLKKLETMSNPAEIKKFAEAMAAKL